MKKLKLTQTRLELLFFLSEKPENEHLSIRIIGKMLNVPKSTIGRGLQYFKEWGILDEETGLLTEQGRQISRDYAQAVGALEKKIANQGVTKQSARQCAMEAIEKNHKGSLDCSCINKEVAVSKDIIPPNYSFSDKKIDYLLPDGEYNVDFLFLSKGEEQQWSMWNNGEGLPSCGKMVFDEGSGEILLPTTQEMDRIECFSDGRWNILKCKKQAYHLPTMLLSFTYKEENKALTGYGTLRRKGKKALFVVILQVK